MKYALLIYSPATPEEYGQYATAARQPDATSGAWGDFAQALQAAGAHVAAEQLTHSETATTIHRDGERRVITDGPFMETKENLLGFYLIEAGNLDEALEWAQRMPVAPTSVIEVRAALPSPSWLPAT
ncbi:MAG TPA: YciI family protein [Trebonia sp.]|jgi:hypothetical protein|nr:YciI family protein [Trebonia sp.]